MVPSPSRRRKATANGNVHTASSSGLEEEGKGHGRSSTHSHRNFLITLGIVGMTVVVFAGVAVYNMLYYSTRGLYRALPRDYFTPAPPATRRSACVDEAQTTVVRAFEEKNWHVIPLRRKSTDPAFHYRTCYETGSASIIWTKLIPNLWNVSQPWQRHNQLPFEVFMSKKASTTQALRAYSHQTGRTVNFLPESYVLPADRKALLKRLTMGTSSLRNGNNGGGDNEPWVVKLSAIDNGIGIAMLGPGSEEMKLLANILRTAKNDEYMTEIRRQLVFSQKGDTRDAAQVLKAQNRTERTHDRIIVQRYICGELDYQGRKFDLRVYFLIASVDPIVVFAHDGYLRVSPHEYNEGKFDSTGEHLTNLGRTAHNSENNTISYEQWQVELRKLVAKNPSRYSWSVQRNPLQHIRNQIKSALADLVAATHKLAMKGYRTHTNMQNGFALFGGDFIVDRDLNVWFTEGQDSPGLLHETSMKRQLNDRLLPATVEIIGQVLDKQSTGQPLFPMFGMGDFELIYTADYQYHYDFERSPLVGPCHSRER